MTHAPAVFGVQSHRSVEEEPPAAALPVPALAFSAFAALVVIGARLWFQTDVRAVTQSSELISLVSLLHGMTLFILLGRNRVTMSGYFMAASAAIVGLSGMLVIPDPYFLAVPQPEVYLNTALLGGALTQIGIGSVCLCADDHDSPAPVLLDDSTARGVQVAGISGLVLTAVLGERLGAFLDGFAFAAIMLVCTASLMSRLGLRSPVNLLLVLLALVAFPTLIISGTGRLRAIALVLAVGYVFFLRYGSRRLKLLGVLLAPVMLALLGLWRREYEESLTGQNGNDTGLSSMFVAIGNFGTLIHSSQEGLRPTLGLSLLSPIRSALPGSITPEWIPEAIGYELTAITDPELHGTGFSTVVSVYGDLWWNFGALGLAIGVPVISFILIRLDTWAVRSYQRAADGPRSLLLLVLFVSLVGGVGDLVWSGIHTWVVRMYGRIAALLILAFLTLYLPTKATRSSYVTFGNVPTSAEKPASDLQSGAESCR